MTASHDEPAAARRGAVNQPTSLRPSVTPVSNTVAGPDTRADSTLVWSDVAHATNAVDPAAAIAGSLTGRRGRRTSPATGLATLAVSGAAGAAPPKTNAATIAAANRRPRVNRMAV